MTWTLLDHQRLQRQLEQLDDPPDADMIRSCELSGGLCLLPEHPGRCITAADILANPKLQDATPCEDCGHWRSHAHRCPDSEAERLTRAEDFGPDPDRDRG